MSGLYLSSNTAMAASDPEPVMTTSGHPFSQWIQVWHLFLEKNIVNLSSTNQTEAYLAYSSLYSVYTKSAPDLVLGVQLVCTDSAQAHPDSLSLFTILNIKIQKRGQKQRAKGMPQFAVPSPPSIPPHFCACPCQTSAGMRRWLQPWGQAAQQWERGRGLLPPVDFPCSCEQLIVLLLCAIIFTLNSNS